MYLALGEELMGGGEVPEVSLQAERQLQEEGPLGLHGGQHGLNHLVVNLKMIILRIL